MSKQQGKLLPAKKIRDIIRLQELGYSQGEIAHECNVARSTVQDYLGRVKEIGLSAGEVENLHKSKLHEFLGKTLKRKHEFSEVIDFQDVHQNLENKECTLAIVWQKGSNEGKWEISYANFCRRYKRWSIEKNVEPLQTRLRHNDKKFQDHKLWMDKLLHGKIKYSELENHLSGKIESKELKVLHETIYCPKQQYRNRSIAIIAYLHSIPNYIIASFLFAKTKTIRNYISIYNSGGVDKLLDFTKKGIKKSEDSKYVDKVFEILHSPPSSHGINRTRWEMKHIQQVMLKYELKISQNNIRKIIRDAGYRFRKAKKVLTSTDPSYQEKLQLITKILSNLGPKEKFFSIDEYGPFSVKIQGGISLVAPGEVRAVPQWQKSKGKLILTAALELSTNQITHFYSDSKNTKEMIKLIDKLLDSYSDEECIYISWDAASWHASQELYEKVEEVNAPQGEGSKHRPIVKLVPLPARAQFLNVIESVFSGMAKAIIHNSNYQSVEDCKNAIDLYIKERNQNFKEHPKRAGKKIWGKEQVESRFRVSNNCKNPNWR